MNGLTERYCDGGFIDILGKMGLTLTKTNVEYK